MLTDIKEERLIVVSDIHIGNPFSSCRRSLAEFLMSLEGAGYSVCINGDGIDVMQSNFAKIAGDIPEMIGVLKKLRGRGLNVYYVIGNHDIVLEHIIHDWEFAVLSPFLNVTSGTSRIRIEHGHLYDSMFINRPHLYEFMTKLAGLVLDFNPQLYKAWHRLEQVMYSSDSDAKRISGEPESFHRGAEEILQRGFDAVVFGHTHQPGSIKLDGGKTYVNSGSWMVAPNNIKIDKGVVSLHTWDGTIA